MVCDNPSARVCSVAERMGISSLVFSPADYASKADYERDIAERCRLYGIELICLAGYMRIVGPTLLDAFAGRIVNLHPSLLPSFKGTRAIEQAMQYGVKVFGATIHYVDESLDGGRIIAQRAVDYDGDDLAEITEMIHAVEHALYIETIKKLLT